MGSLPHLVVHFPLRLILKYFVGSIDLFKLFFSYLVSRSLVRMVLLSEFVVSFLNIPLFTARRHAQNLIEVLFLVVPKAEAGGEVAPRVKETTTHLD
jgi:hypothetical protein